jgi:KEOPS complex subunit Pcc1
MIVLKKVEAQFEIELDSQKEAEIVLSSILPEISESPSDRTTTDIRCDDKTLTIDIKAQDSPSLRASLNSYLRWIILSRGVLELSK